MKPIHIAIALMFVLTSCKKETSEQTIVAPPEKELKQPESIQEKVAYAYGIDQWVNVKQVDFSFVVNPGEQEFVRRWSWQPKLKLISLIKEDDTLTYNRNDIKEELVQTDKGFVNDSFWLLFPFHLVWDDVEIETFEDQTSPILKQSSTKLNVIYPAEGGYTPGDRYEVYVNDTYHILEWTYHRGGGEEVSLGNTFEKQQTFSGITIDMEHANPETGFQLNFRDVVIK